MARKNKPSPLLLSLVANLVAGYMWLVRRLMRWEIVGAENLQSLATRDEGAIAAYWHARFFMMPSLRRYYPRGAVSLSSNHKDAEFMVATLKKVGIDAVRGSSASARKPGRQKGGIGAFRQLLGKIKEGKVVGVTPDGPKGPAFKAKLGTVQLARMAGAPIIPIAFSTRHAKRFDSWDRYMLPLPVPFGKGVIVIGEPYEVKARGDEEMKQASIGLEQALNAVTLKADQLAGVVPDERMSADLDPAEAS
ncbi:MAG: lysophospholipid acyltransferase family protein [Parvularcula sp.]